MAKKKTTEAAAAAEPAAPGLACAGCESALEQADRPRVRLTNGRELHPVICSECLPAWLAKKPGAEIVKE